MPRLAIAFEFPTLSGGERSMLAVLQKSPPADWDVVAIAPPKGPLAEQLRVIGVPIEPLDVRDSGNKPPPDWTAEMLNEALQRVQPATTHANSLSMARTTGRWKRRYYPNGQVATTAHIRDMMKLSRAAVGDVNGNDALVCVSEATQRFHLDQGIEAARTRIIYNGVTAEPPSQPAGWLREQLGVGPEVKLIATIGQICLRKGHDTSARALADLGDIPWRWLIIGERFSQKAESVNFDAAIEATLAQTSPELAMRAVRLGYRDDMADIYPELDLVLHTARQEPLGRVLLEAGAYGIPVVATDVGGTREIVGESVPLVPANDADETANHLATALRDPEHYRFGTEQFTVSACRDQLWSLWQGVSIEQQTN